MKKILLILFSLLFYSLSFATPLFKQGNVVRLTATGGTASYTSNVTAGSVLFGIGFFEDNVSDISSITDTRGNTWVQFRSFYSYFDIDGGVNNRIVIWKTSNTTTAGANTLTVNWTGGGTALNLHLLEYSIAAPTNLDGSSISAAWADDPTSGNVTTTQAGDLLIGFCVNNGGDATPPAGYTSRTTHVFNKYTQVFDKVAGAAGTENQQITTVSTNRGINTLFAITDGAATGGGGYKKLILLGAD